MKKILLILVFLAFSFRLWQTTGCRNFLPTYFDPQIVKINVEEQVSVDRNINREVSRFFHNKASTGFFELTKSTLKVLEPIVLLEILGPLGLFLTALSLVYLARKFTLTQAAHFAVVLCAIISTIFIKNSKLSFYILTLALYTFSVWGTSSIKTTKLTIFGFFILTVITLWYFAFSWQITSICNEIFFN